MKVLFILRYVLCCALFYAISSCAPSEDNLKDSSVQLIVLGIAQDAGSPQIGCKKNCCAGLHKKSMVSCLALYDPTDSLCILLDATPDITGQMKLLDSITGSNIGIPDAIFLSHAHIGHYTGLMYLGRESAGTKELKVFAMPRMKNFLQSNGPWSMLVDQSYIKLLSLKNDSTVSLNERINITPIQVPHRDEFSETVGFIINVPNKNLLFIPDIDKWEKWDRDINQLISSVDLAFLDGTFYDDDELPGRNMAEIPHPFISESMDHFSSLKLSDRNKVHFIHLNHTNPALDAESDAYKTVLNSGFRLARQGWSISL